MRANGERRLRLYQKFADAPGQAKPDWWIVAQMASRMGYDGFDWQNSNDVAEESSRFSRGSRKDFNMIKVAAHAEGKTLHQKLAEFGTEGIQGPVFYNYDTKKLIGTKRLHDTEMSWDDLVDKGLQDGPQGANIMRKQLTQFNSQTGKVNLQKTSLGSV
ncbi:Arsenite oxidase subunit AioA [Vibrio syngnathi]|uniref:Arsenite oxidase subunit AioA n=1 Tax=Vibrio syngnathi TaxID=3034029 RepID=A0AA34TSL9_9VIBR|nr:Arsenite oxidase subunit AioA [Vibrio syngnathi]